MWRLIEHSEHLGGNANLLRDWPLAKLTAVRQECITHLIDAGLRQSAADANRFARVISLIDDELTSRRRADLNILELV